jgi:hypothetical protein
VFVSELILAYYPGEEALMKLWSLPSGCCQLSIRRSAESIALLCWLGDKLTLADGWMDRSEFDS